MPTIDLWGTGSSGNGYDVANGYLNTYGHGWSRESEGQAGAGSWCEGDGNGEGGDLATGGETGCGTGESYPHGCGLGYGRGIPAGEGYSRLVDCTTLHTADDSISVRIRCWANLAGWSPGNWYVAT